MKFDFQENEEKPLAFVTLQIYERLLNKLAKEIDVSSADDLVEHADKVVTWIDKNIPSMPSKKQFVASVMYVLNRKEYNNAMRIPYVVYFFKLKIKQIEDNTSLAKEEKDALIKRLKHDLKELSDM